MALITAADIPTGLVTGTFYFVSEDNADTDTDPTLTVVSGTVVFTPVDDQGRVIQRLQLIGKMATAIPQQFNAKFDALGQLIPAKGNGIGVRLIASSAPEINPTGWKWRVDYNLTYAGTNRTVNLPSHYFTLDTGQTVDLTAAMPMVETQTVLTLRGETGPQGPKGADSTVPGPKGDKGDPGATGATGPAGPAKFPTGTRPTPDVAGEGGIFFDTVLKKPLWSTGTAWVDATGTAVA